METEEEERPKANIHSAPQEPKPPSTSAKPQSPRRPGRRRMNRTGGQLKQPQPELERGKKLQKQEPRRPDKPENQAQATGRNPRTTQSTEEHPRNTSTREATIPTRRQQVNTATDRLARRACSARKRTKSVPSIAKSEDRHHGQEKQAIARLTASDSGERAIANDRATPPRRAGERARSWRER